MSPRPLTAVVAVCSTLAAAAPVPAAAAVATSSRLAFDIPFTVDIDPVEAELGWGDTLPTDPHVDQLLSLDDLPGMAWPKPATSPGLSFSETVAPAPAAPVAGTSQPLELPAAKRIVLSTKGAASLRASAAVFTSADLHAFRLTKAQYSYSALKSEAASLIRRPPRTLRGASDLACLAVAIYHEARSESTHGQLAVASVIQQRAQVPGRWGNDACDVVRPVQFSFMTSRYGFPSIDERGAWETAVNLAVKSIIDGPLPELKAADHYHTTGVHPGWRHAMIKVGRIGRHIFYRDPSSPRA